MKRLRTRTNRDTTACKRHTFRPLLESLEDRLVLSMTAPSLVQPSIASATVGAISSGPTVANAVLFQDNFASGMSNWQTSSAAGDCVAVVPWAGGNRLGFDTHGSSSYTGWARGLAGESSWTNYSYQAVVNLDNMKAGAVNLLARMQDGTHGYAFGFDVTLGQWTIALENGSTVTTLASSGPFALQPDHDYTVRTDLNGTALTLYVDDVLQVAATDSTYASGKIGFAVNNSSSYGLNQWGVGYLGNVVISADATPQPVVPVAEPTPSAIVTLPTAASATATNPVLFQDNFGAGLSNWQMFAGSGTNLAVVSWPGGGNRLGVDTHGGTSDWGWAGQSTWTNYNYQAVVNLDNMKAGGVNLLARMQDGSHGYAFGYNVSLGQWTVGLENGSTVTTLASSTPFALQPDHDYTVRADLNGTALTLTVDGALQVSATDSTYTSGKIGFSVNNSSSYGPTQWGVGYLGNVVVSPDAAPQSAVQNVLASMPASVMTSVVSVSAPSSPTAPSASSIQVSPPLAVHQTATATALAPPAPVLSTTAELVRVSFSPPPVLALHAPIVDPGPVMQSPASVPSPQPGPAPPPAPTSDPQLPHVELPSATNSVISSTGLLPNIPILSKALRALGIVQLVNDLTSPKLFTAKGMANLALDTTAVIWADNPYVAVGTVIVQNTMAAVNPDPNDTIPWLVSAFQKHFDNQSYLANLQTATDNLEALTKRAPNDPALRLFLQNPQLQPPAPIETPAQIQMLGHNAIDMVVDPAIEAQWRSEVKLYADILRFRQAVQAQVLVDPDAGAPVGGKANQSGDPLAARLAAVLDLSVLIDAPSPPISQALDPWATMYQNGMNYLKATGQSRSLIIFIPDSSTPGPDAAGTGTTQSQLPQFQPYAFGQTDSTPGPASQDGPSASLPPGWTPPPGVVTPPPPSQPPLPPFQTPPPAPVLQPFQTPPPQPTAPYTPPAPVPVQPVTHLPATATPQAPAQVSVQPVTHLPATATVQAPSQVPVQPVPHLPATATPQAPGFVPVNPITHLPANATAQAPGFVPVNPITHLPSNATAQAPGFVAVNPVTHLPANANPGTIVYDAFGSHLVF